MVRINNRQEIYPCSLWFVQQPEDGKVLKNYIL